MKHFKYLIILVLLISTPAYSGGLMIVGGGAPAAVANPCAGADTNLGATYPTPTVTTDLSIGGGNTWGSIPGVVISAGKTNICTMRAYVKYVTSSANILMAVYSTKGTSPYNYSGLVCQGVGTQVASGTDYAWITWTYGGAGATGLIGSCTLTPGNTYYYLVTTDTAGTTTDISSQGYDSYSGRYGNIYTGGFPDPTATFTVMEGSGSVGMMIGVQ